MSNNQRIAALEEAALRKMRGDDAAEEWRELRQLFCDADVSNASLIGMLAATHGTRRLPVLVEQSAELGHRLGVFCQDNRFAVPEAKRILVRHIPRTDRRMIVRSGDTSDSKFLHIWECNRP
jgi:hypothetical protein